MAQGTIIWRTVVLSLAVGTTSLFSGLLAAPARSEPPAAIVEDVRAANAGVRAFDYVTPGQVIELGESGFLIVGYLRSCLREIVTGGQVVIGKLKSEIQAGAVSRDVVECDGGQAELAPEEAGESGVVVHRALVPDGETGSERPLHIYSASPFFTFSNPVKSLRIKRLDGLGETLVLTVRQQVLDFARLGKVLASGARYEASAGRQTLVFMVDLHATAGSGPLVSRLVRF